MHVVILATAPPQRLRSEVRLTCMALPHDVLAPEIREVPASRPYRARVRSVTQLSESYLRIVFTSPRFATFGVDRLDQRIKLAFPLANGYLADFGADLDDLGESFAWYATWRQLAEHERNPIRTYTVRDVNQADHSVTVDFVCHGDAGPASRWARAAVPGDEIILVGPDSRSTNSSLGIDFRPGMSQHILLVGDETAAPAICSILECLPAAQDVSAFIEVPRDGDVQQIFGPHASSATWLPRGHDRVGELLVPAVTQWLDQRPGLIAAAAAARLQRLEDIDVDVDMLWDSPEAPGAGEFYAWLAGESAVIKTLRRALVTTRGIDRTRVAFMGYWREGRSENNG